MTFTKRLIMILTVIALCVCISAVSAFASNGGQYYVAGYESLCGSSWEAGDLNNLMSEGENGIYTKVYENVPAGTYQLKVTDGTWDNSWGNDTGEDGNCLVTVETNGSTVTVIFDSVNETVSTEVVLPDGGCAHTYEAVVTAPTCMWEGYTTYTCVLCGSSYYGDYTGLGDHQYEVFKIVPGCVTGYTVYACIQCTTSYNEYVTGITGHQYGEDNVCINCGVVDTGEYYVAGDQELCGSSWEANDYANIMTEGSDGVYSKIYEDVPAGTYELKVTDGTWNNSWGDGTGEYGNCLIIVETNGSTITVMFHPATENVSVEVVFPEGGCEHVYETVVTPPNCIAEGYTSHICTICGDSYINNFTDRSDHQYASVVTAPTPEVNGYTTHTCIHCGDSYSDSETMYGMIAFGSYGYNLTWTLSEEGVLTISGDGVMMSGEWGTPWACYSDLITNAVIKPGITAIGNYAFNSCVNLTTVTIPEGLTTITYYAFDYCTELTDVYYGGSMDAWREISIFPGNEHLENANIHCSDGDLVDMPWISKLENTASGIKITWGVVEGAENYRVYAKTSKGWLNIGTTTDTSFVYTGAKSGYTYTFTVRCLNAEGTAFASSYNPHGWKQTYVAQPAISKLESTANGIKLTWDAVAGAGKYRVYAKTSKGWLNIGTTTGTSLVYSGAKTGLTYTFTIRALNAEGTAFVSSFNTTGWRHKYMPVPQIFKFESTAEGIRITWNAVNGAAKYRVFAKTSKGWLNIGTTAGTSFVWTGAKTGLTYTFTVRCVNAAGTAFTSSYNTTGWRYRYMPAPTVTKLENTYQGIRLTWDPVNGAAMYRVFVKTSKGWVTVGTTTDTSFTWTGAKTGYTYCFTVRCVNAANNAFTSSYNTSGWSIKRI